jgi:ADP-heptose:LPS heptosyltransferase
MKPRLLVVELHHLGDAVLALPFVRAAMRTHEVHILCRPGPDAIFRLLAPPPLVHPWDPPWAGGKQVSVAAAIDAARTEGIVLRPLAFEAAVCVWPDPRAGIIMAETRASRRIGFPPTAGNYYAGDIPWRRRRRIFGRVLETAWQMIPGRGSMLTDELHRISSDQPHLASWQQIAIALGTSCDTSVPWFQPGTTPSASSLRCCGKPVLAIHASARLPSKQWPVDRWRELLASPGVADRFSLLEILPADGQSVTDPSAVRINTPTVPDLAAALQCADAVLCHDSLPAHMAAALGKPVVAIFGSGEPDWFAPWNNRNLVVQRRVCPLHPCIDRCGMDRYLCLNSITPNDVVDRLRKLPMAP